MNAGLELLSNLDPLAHAINPNECMHYWRAFLDTPEFSGPYDDWQTYCMGTEI